MIIKNIQPNVSTSNAGMHIYKFVLLFLILANIFDMGGAFYLKYLSIFLACMYVMFFTKRFPIRYDEVIVLSFLFLVWPIVSLYIGHVNDGELSVGISQITSFPVAILFLILISNRSPGLPVATIYKALLFLSIVVIAFYVILLVAPKQSFFWNTLYSLSNTGQGYFGERNVGGLLLPNIYSKATLFLVPATIYYLFSGSKLFIIPLLALVASLSKAGLLISLFFVAIFFFSSNSVKLFSKVLVVSITVGALVLIVNVVPALQGEIVSAVTGEHKTTQVRLGHIKSLAILFEEHPVGLLLGMGVGTEFYSTGANAYVNNIEIDHFNVVRKFGLIWFCGFLVFISIIVVRLFKRQDNTSRASSLALIGCFLAAGTNPVLISPLFMMILMASYNLSRKNCAR